MPPKTKTRPSGETEPALKKQRKSSSPEPPSGVLTQQQEEEMSSAYIAQLLAQEGYDEHPYYSQYHSTTYDNFYENDDKDDDDDYNPSSRPKSKKTGLQYILSLKWQISGKKRQFYILFYKVLIIT
jgi:hypothetical protein